MSPVGKDRASCFSRLGEAACNRGHQKDFISILKGVGIPAEKADVFLVDVDIQESANLPCIIPKMRPQVRKLLIKRRKQFSKICRRAGNSFDA